MRKSKVIQYDLIFPNGDHCQQVVSIDPETLNHQENNVSPPEWCDLEFHKCSICPLSKELHPVCPVAKSVLPLLDFPMHSSYEPVTVKVTKENVTISSECTVQEAYRSLVGLLIATSGCPHTEFFRPMAWFHLPFATQEETIFRACASFLLFQFFNPEEPEQGGYFSDLRTVYENIHQVNLDIAERLKASGATSSTLNAIVILDIFAKSILPVLNESLSELSFLFKKKPPSNVIPLR